MGGVVFCRIMSSSCRLGIHLMAPVRCWLAVGSPPVSSMDPCYHIALIDHFSNHTFTGLNTGAGIAMRRSSTAGPEMQI